MGPVAEQGGGMKLGLWITARFGRGVTFEEHFRHMRDQVGLARDGGFGMIAGGQHYLGPRLQTFPLLARLAADAGDMEIATAVVLLPLQNPVDLAEQAATMNAMLDGRFILGVGLGHQADEREAFGIARESVVPRFEEALQVMERVWDGDGRPFQGQYYRLPALDLAWPIPYRRPRVWIGGSSDKGFQRARSHGLPWFPSEFDLDALAQRYDAHPAVPDVPGSATQERPVGAWVHIAETDEQARADATRLGHLDAEGRPMAVAIIGSPDTVVDRMRAYRERIGATHLLARVQPPGMAQADAMRRIELLAERVLPRLG
jgi:alkanesulfonate monooxygenase SsuD/methylene tetrahydromethanopterin reductase-like flavin-dependent oxidoreductase (luciferase family)